MAATSTVNDIKAIADQVRHFATLSDPSATLQIEHLDRDQRKAIHRLCESLHLYSLSDDIGNGRRQLTIYRTKPTARPELEPRDLKMFVRYANKRYAVWEEPYLSYAVQVFDGQEEFDQFRAMIRQYGRGHPDAVTEAMVKAIQASTGYARLTQKDPLVHPQASFKPCRRLVMPPKLNIYEQEIAHGQKHHYVSIDMVKANFNTARKFDASLVLDCQTWPELVSKFTDCAFLAQSKFFREEVFGKATKVSALAAIYKCKTSELFEKLSKIHDDASDKPLFNIVSGSGDELTIQIEKDADWSDILEAVKTHVGDLQTWRVEAFSLEGIGRSMGRLRVNLETGKQDIKFLNPTMTLEAMLWLQDKPVDEKALKFMQDGRLASYAAPFHF